MEHVDVTRSPRNASFFRVRLRSRSRKNSPFFGVSTASDEFLAATSPIFGDFLQRHPPFLGDFLQRHPPFSGDFLQETTLLNRMEDSAEKASLRPAARGGDSPELDAIDTATWRSGDEGGTVGWRGMARGDEGRPRSVEETRTRRSGRPVSRRYTAEPGAFGHKSTFGHKSLNTVLSTISGVVFLS